MNKKQGLIMVNKVILIGRLGRDPEIKTSTDGREVAKFSIATSERWKDKNTGERKEKTEWCNVVIFNENLVKIVKEYVKKGSQIYVEGKFCTRKWEKDGIERYSTEVVLQNYDGKIELLDKKEGGSHQPNPDDYGYSSDNNDPAYQSPPPAGLDDDIPFAWIAPFLLMFSALGGVA